MCLKRCSWYLSALAHEARQFGIFNFKLSAERLVTSTYVITDETTEKLILDKFDRRPMVEPCMLVYQLMKDQKIRGLLGWRKAASCA